MSRHISRDEGAEGGGDHLMYCKSERKVILREKREIREGRGKRKAVTG